MFSPIGGISSMLGPEDDLAPAAHPVDVPSQVKLKRASLPYAQATPPQHTRPPWRMQAGSPIGKVRRLYGQVVPLEMEVR